MTGHYYFHCTATPTHFFQNTSTEKKKWGKKDKTFKNLMKKHNGEFLIGRACEFITAYIKAQNIGHSRLIIVSLNYNIT